MDQRGALTKEQERSRRGCGGGGARVGLGGCSPPLLLGKRVGPDDALSPSPSRCDSWAPCAASLPAGGLGGRGSGLVP